MELLPQNCPQFYTATIEAWKHLLKEDKYKAVIVHALKHVVVNKQVKVNAFVIMDNYIHLNWQALHGYPLNAIQTSFKKYTSKQFTKLCSADKHITQYEV